MALEIDLKDINWKQQLSTGLKILMDPKLLVSIASIALVVWQSNETFFAPTQKDMATREQALTAQKQLIAERQQTKQQYDVWQRELKGLSTSVIKLKDTDNARIVALSKSSELVEMARNLNSSPDDPNALPPPHNQLKNVSITATGNTIVDIMADAAPAQPPSEMEDMGGGEGGPPSPAQTTSVKLERFDYEMKMQGTYPALARFINELVTRDNLVAINEVLLTKSGNADEPDAAEFPDYPVPVDMTLKISLFLFNPKQSF